LSDNRCRVAILISGSGSNLQAFIDQVQNGRLDLDIVTVVSNQADAFGLERAAKANIPTRLIDHRDFAERELFDRAVASRLDALDIDLVILAGFMRILSPWFVQHFAGRILNIHPALLPAYPGLDTHQRVLDAGEQWHGSTVHFVTEELDGGPLIFQGRITVNANENAAELAARVQTVEHQIYPQVAAMFASGQLRFRDNQAMLGDDNLVEPISKDFE